MFVTIAFLWKNSVDYKSMSLAKSIFIRHCLLIYLKKLDIFGEQVYCIHGGELWKQTRFLARYSMLIYLRIVQRNSIGVDMQPRYYSQFKISVSLEVHQGFQKLPLKVSHKTSRFLENNILTGFLKNLYNFHCRIKSSVKHKKS